MELEYLKKQLRLTILGSYKNANAGHIGCSLSCIDILILLFFKLKNNGENIILSKGHAALALYVTLNSKGEITDEELATFYKDGTKLPAHPAPNKFESIPFALGSLGHGLPIAAGIAQANKLLDNGLKTYVLMSDGETNEGTTWEALHYACSKKLDNLIVFIDKNGLQGFGKTKDIFGDTANSHTFRSIGIDCVEADGHDLISLSSAMKEISISNGKPKLVICNTIKGKGVDFMEDRVEWHYLPMNEIQYQEAINSLNKNYTGEE